MVVPIYMLNAYLYAIASTIIVSLVSFIGVLSLPLGEKRLNKIIALLVSISAGALLGDAFFHLMPEAVEKNSGFFIWLWLVAGIIVFFILEKIVCWRHCHIPTSTDHPHRLGIMNLVGDGLHNFIDGTIIAASFLISIPLGIASAIAVIAHEAPQELSDFGVLIYAGYSKSKALLLNFLSAIIAVFGAIIGLLIGAQMENFITYIIPFAAGGFIYIAAADIIPELHKETEIKKSAKQLAGILIGIAIMIALKFWK